VIRRLLHSDSFVPIFAQLDGGDCCGSHLAQALSPGLPTMTHRAIATYSVAGAQLGTKLLWTALLTWPLMAAVPNDVCPNRQGDGAGLAGNFKQRFPRWLIRVFIVALLAANTINIAADLAGMADAAEMLSGINSHWFVVVFALLISWATIRLPYHQIRTCSNGWCWCSSPTPLPRL